MGMLINLFIQRLLPATKKSIWVDFRKKNGAWTSFLLPPTATDFREHGLIYYLKGRPDINNSTNQRKYTFLQGVPYPIGYDSEHDNLLRLNADFGNIALQLTEADEHGYQKAALLMGKKKVDLMQIIVILSAVTLLLVLVQLYFAYSNSELIASIVRSVGGG